MENRGMIQKGGYSIYFTGSSADDLRATDVHPSLWDRKNGLDSQMGSRAKKSPQRWSD
jgi:hypothetical protein